MGAVLGCFTTVSGLLWGCFGAAMGAKIEGYWWLELRTKIEEVWPLWWLASARIRGGKEKSKVVILGCTRRRKTSALDGMSDIKIMIIKFILL
jgi:hypothetical protein